MGVPVPEIDLRIFPRLDILFQFLYPYDKKRENAEEGTLCFLTIFPPQEKRR